MPATKDREQIKSWAKEHKAHPAIVKGTDGLLRFDFEEAEKEENLEPISWEKFFEIFDDRGIELVYDEDKNSRFHKFTYPQQI
jgi:hypothetical protein